MTRSFAGRPTLRQRRRALVGIGDGWLLCRCSGRDAGARAEPTRRPGLVRTPGDDRADPRLDPPRRRRHGRQAHPRPTCAGSPPATRSSSPTATPGRCPTANTSAATNATSAAPITSTASPSTSSRLNGDPRPCDASLGTDHPPRRLGRAGTGTTGAALPLGRLQRRRRPRLRQPPPPLLEARPGEDVRTRRMGRSLPRRPRPRAQGARKPRPARRRPRRNCRPAPPAASAPTAGRARAPVRRLAAPSRRSTVGSPARSASRPLAELSATLGDGAARCGVMAATS